MYSKKAVLGGRLIGNQKIREETMSESNIRQHSAKYYASLLVGIDLFSVKGSRSDEHGANDSNTKEEKTNKKLVDWTAVGGNPADASK